MQVIYAEPAPEPTSDAISVNFGFGATDITGTAGVGAYSTNNWNNATGVASGTLSGLVDSAGLVTGASINWASNEIWHRSDTAADDNARLMKSFLNHKPFNNDRSLNSQYPSTVTLNGLPTGTYSLVIYTDGDENNIDRVTVFNVNDGSGVVTKTGNDVVQYPVDGYLADSGLDYRVTGDSLDYGNYIVFDNLSGSTLQIEFYGQNNVSWRGHLNGLQVVYAVSAPDTESPTAPQNLTVTGTTTSSVSLSWDASTDNVAVAGYEIYRDGSYINATSDTQFTDTGLSASTTYSYSVLAYDAADNLSGLTTIGATTDLTQTAAGIISVKFGSSATDITGTAGANTYGANNWNNATGSVSGSMSNLVDSTGVTTSAGVTWSTNEIWYRSDTAVDDDDRLMKSFLNDTPPNGDRSQNSTGPSTVTLSGLPSGSYTLVLYSDGDENNIQRATVFEVNDGSGVVSKIANDVVQYPVDGYIEDSGLDYRTTNGMNDYGNYVVFDNLSGSTVDIAFYGLNDISFRGHLNGLQVVYTTSDPDTEAPTVPQNLTVTGTTSSSAALSWNASTDNIAVAGYEIYRDGSYIDSISGVQYTDTGLNASTTYSYSVLAYDNANNKSGMSSTVSAQTTDVVAAEKPRIIIMTDFGVLNWDGTPWIGDPDDYQSMTRALLYSNMVDIEGLICSTSHSVKYALYPNELKAHIDAYGQVRSNLLLHEDGYPTADYLKSVVKSGNVESSVYGMDAVGTGKSSEGSNWIISVVDSSDPRPVYILAWGGTNTLAQALYDIQATRTQTEVNDFLSKIRVYPIAKQDSAYDWIITNFVQAGDPDKQLFWIDGAAGVWKGMSAGPSTIYDVQGGDESLVTHTWIDQSLRNKGDLSIPQRYPYHSYIMEGDTPSFFYILPIGIGDPERPNLGGWGGRYSAAEPLHTAEVDTVGGYSEMYASIWRWRLAYQNDFEARMDWCVQPYSGANHPPVVIVDGPLEFSVTEGTTVNLNAQNSYDPDGNSLAFSWIQYSEADSYPGTVTINSANTANASFTAPSVSSSETIQVLLSVTDNGSPNLSRYKQLIITVNPDTGYSTTGVPHYEIDFSQDIETWWAGLSFNPESPNYNPTIPSPSYTLNVANYNGSIQATIDALPADGGTVYVPNGVYTDNFGIIARDNVHIVGESRDGVIIRALAWDPDGSTDHHHDDHHMIKVGGTESAIDYTLFDSQTSLGKADFNLDEWNALINKRRNIAFRNLTFDGQGIVNGAIDFSAVMDILVENCEFKNFTHSIGYHEPAITGHAHIDNILVRDCIFRDAIDTPLMFYMDGVHGCYMVNNEFYGKLLFLCNDDFTEDLNENGVTDEYEERESKYVVIYNNDFLQSTYDPLSFTGSGLLFKNNYLPINVSAIATCNSRFSHQDPSLVYRFFNLRFIGNQVQGVATTLVRLVNNANPAPVEYSDPLMGYIDIKDNYISNTPTDGAYVIVDPPVVDGTITVSGNLYGQTWPPVN